MAEVVVLSQGYSRMIGETTMQADGSCTLVKTSDELILVDTLGPWNGDKLIQLIQQQGYHLEDITYVVCTHGHADHCGNLNLFTGKTRRMASLIQDQDRAENDLLGCSARPSKIKKHIVGNGIYNDDQYLFDLKNEDRVFQINPIVSVRETPGHTLSCVSVLVENAANLGRVAITGDLFEREEDLEDESIWIDAGSEAIDDQRENRQFILDNFDWIVPGHGPMFKVRK